ncbi:MAG: UDP-N-acetylmuramoylalanyl-D-glutamyl-2 6-diaminopimelate/D-alanyl-D-alanyl ligase [Bacillota bacterium]|nr:MAG: UDP-N-acetylmuramoylalanyl-D-glutamyl-2 6-diaminopimelate/D-alanyl-D-alanyl ligase [Bacillota bacterium]
MSLDFLVPLKLQVTTRNKRIRLGFKVVAVTGTAGKTTTKEMIASILRLSRTVKSTPGNLNLPVHVRQIIEAATLGDTTLVLELGMARPGQISQSSYMAAPNVAIVTNVNRGHVEKCGSMAGVILAKSEIIRGMGAGSVLIINADDHGSQLLRLEGFQGRIIKYGKAPETNYRIVKCETQGLETTFVVHAESEQRTLTIPIAGEHNAHNATAAVAATRVLGCSWSDIECGLTKFSRLRGRLTPYGGINNSVVLDDSFNANPLSVVAGLKTLKAAAGGRTAIAVLGNMEEQGPKWPIIHMQLGREVAAIRVDRLITVGEKAAYIARGAESAGMLKEKIHAFVTRAGAIELLQKLLDSNTMVLVKGSHSAGLSQVVKAIICM